MCFRTLRNTHSAGELPTTIHRDIAPQWQTAIHSTSCNRHFHRSKCIRKSQLRQFFQVPTKWGGKSRKEVALRTNRYIRTAKLDFIDCRFVITETCPKGQHHHRVIRHHDREGCTKNKRAGKEATTVTIDAIPKISPNYH